MDEFRQRVIGMAAEAAMSEDPFGWFEEIYTSADGDWQQVPWAAQRPHPLFSQWLEAQSTDWPKTRRALVVGCGLGEDAAYLDENGWQVTAFDISKTAIDWAQKIHSGSEVEWHTADLLNLPQEWFASFDLVVEIHILQAMPQELCRQGAEILPRLVSESGFLVCIGRIRQPEDEIVGPPWPLTRQAINQIGESLVEIEFCQARFADDIAETNRYRAVWRR